MNENINDGGPAFPFSEDHGDGSPYYVHSGMALRDWFAGQALAGMKASETAESFYRNEQIGETAYKIADAMLKARNA